MKFAIIAIIALPMIEAAIIHSGHKAQLTSGHADAQMLKANKKFEDALKAVSAMADKQKRTEEEKSIMAAEYLEDEEELMAKQKKWTKARSGTTLLDQSDFAAGTFQITESGTYKLVEDVAFLPNGPTYTPALTSETYKQGDGYFLGFFAAVTIETDGVVFNCDGNEISMHTDFHKRQRFFSVIELASRPFIPNAGPPPLSNPAMNPDAEIRSGTDVTIKNCFFGLTSHHSIHGNNNEGIDIRDSTFYDFEVGAIALNNCHGVFIRRNDIGPSLSSAWPATLSQAVFLAHMGYTIGMGDSSLAPVFASTIVPLRGVSTQTAENVVTTLQTQLTSFLDNDNADLMGELEPLLNHPGNPDGSAMYGILLHKTAPAVGEFGACPIEEYLNGTEPLISGTRIRWMDIRDFGLNPEAWISLHQDQSDGSSRQVQGPAGAVFRATHWEGESGEYVGNALSDAHIAIATMYDAAINGDDETAQQRAADYFVAAYVPQEIRDWAESGTSTLDYSQFNLKCDGDAMSHFNKGVVGIRLGYQENPRMGPRPHAWRDHRRRGIVIRSLTNHGVAAENPDLCEPVGYQGNDVRATRLTNCVDVRGVDIGNFVPGVGGTIANSENFETLSKMELDRLDHLQSD